MSTEARVPERILRPKEGCLPGEGPSTERVDGDAPERWEEPNHQTRTRNSSPLKSTFSKAPRESALGPPLARAVGAEPVPGYRLVTRMGKGGAGEVWKARGPGGFPVALKFIDLEDGEAGAELRSLGLLREIRHANLVTVFGAWQNDGVLVVAMELADRTLWDRYREAVRAGSPGIPRAELIEYLGEAAKAIDYLNEPRHNLLGRERVGVQHRDIKPHNLLLVGDTVKVADFGLAQLV